MSLSCIMPSKALHKRERCVHENQERRGGTRIETHFLSHPPTLLDGGSTVQALPVGYSCSARFHMNVGIRVETLVYKGENHTASEQAMAALAKPPDSTACRLLGGTFAVMWCGILGGGELGGWGRWRGLKRQGRWKTESKRAQGPLVKHKEGERERTSEVRVKLQLSTP